MNLQSSTSTPSASRQAPARQPLSDEAVDAVAEWLRVIAEPMRIRLIEILKTGSSSVQGLAAQLRTSRPNISKHLAVLRQAGFVKGHKVGNHTLYELVDWSGCWLIDQVVTSVAPDSQA